MRRALVLLAAMAALASLPGTALADGDPASDTIIGVDAFLPYTPPVSGAVARRLTATLKAARAKGKPLKAVVIGSAPDLGSVSSLFGQPQKYAEFLSREDAFAVKDPVLVVMGKGLGFAKTGAPLDLGFAKDVKVPGNATSDQLATAATDAAGRYAGIKVAGLPTSGSGGGTSGYVIAAIVIGVLTLVGVGVAMLLRARRAGSPA